MSDLKFKSAYASLEDSMSAHAKARGEIYVPNIVPHGPAKYIFICMEPSLGGWARNREEAEFKVQAGFRNFVDGTSTMILHFAIRSYLCRAGEQYHITDLSKAAMLVQHAEKDRMSRYKDWYSLLLQEIGLVASDNAHVFAVGVHVSKFLNTQDFPYSHTKLIHYSPRAASHWNKAVVEHMVDFQLFQDSISYDMFLDSARATIDGANLPNLFKEQSLAKLHTESFSDSMRALMFNYKLIFESVYSAENG